MNQTVVITGASGFLGTELVKHFAAKQWHVIALVRKPSEYSSSEYVRYESYDLRTGFDENIFQGADYCIHTAYVKQDHKNPDAMAVNTEAAQKLIAASRAHGLKKNVFISSMSAHEEAVSVYGRQKLKIESIFSGSTDVSLRCGLIIGRGGIVQEMASFMKSKGMVPLIGGGKQPLQIVSVYDLVQVIEKALVAEGLSGVFTVANPRVYSYKQFYQALGSKLKVKLFFVPVPFWAMLGLLRTAGLLGISLGVNEDNLWGLKKLRAVDTQADLAALGVSVGTLEEALDRVDFGQL